MALFQNFYLNLNSNNFSLFLGRVGVFSGPYSLTPLFLATLRFASLFALLLFHNFASYHKFAAYPTRSFVNSGTCTAAQV